MKQAEVFYDLLIDSKEGMKTYIENGKSFFFSLSIFIISIFSIFISSLIIDRIYNIGSTTFLLFSLLIKISIYLLLWILFASIFHFICSCKKFEGNIINLFLLLGISFFPFILLPSGAIISQAVTPGNNIVYSIMFMISAVWSIRLQMQTMNIVYNISFDKSFWIYFIPFLVLLGFVILMILFAVISMVSLLFVNL